MDDETAPTAWQETGGIVPGAAGQLSMRSATSSQGLNTDVAPIRDTPDNRIAFASAIGRCLALTAPAGMGRDERRSWLAAAFDALRHLPMDLVEAGAREAARTADHPSKIVPAIIAATESELAWRQRHQSAIVRTFTAPALPAPGEERPNRDEVDAICKQFAVGRYAPTQPHRDPAQPIAQPAHVDPARPCRVPTREDYIRMGVNPAVLDGLAAPVPQANAA